MITLALGLPVGWMATVNAILVHDEYVVERMRMDEGTAELTLVDQRTGKRVLLRLGPAIPPTDP